MANGIKLRRGLKAALATTIAEGEFVLCTDTGELGFKKGASEVYIDLDKVATDIDDLQDSVGSFQELIDNVIDNQEVLLPGEFKVMVNKFYDFSVLGTKPKDNGGYRIPIAKVNPLFIGEEFDLHQVFNFTNAIIQTHNFDGYGVFSLSNFSLDNLIVDTQSDGYGGFTLHYNETSSSSECGLQILDDGYGNFALWLEVEINSTQTKKLSVKFTMTCLSESDEDINEQPYNVFLPPLGLEIIPYNGAA